MKETDTKGEKTPLLCLCQKCGLYQNKYDWEIERTIANDHTYLDKFACRYCGWINEYRFPRW